MSYVSRDLFFMNIDKLAAIAASDESSALRPKPNSYGQRKRMAQRKTSQGVSQIGEGLQNLGAGVRDYWANQFNNGVHNFSRAMGLDGRPGPIRRGWARGAAKRAQITQAAEANRQSR